MIDPKLNEIPVKPLAGSAVPVEEDTTKTAKQPRQGLSIKDTIAGDTTLSVGGRGVDTSGTSAGAGAGAGMTSLSTAPSGSPAPDIVPGQRSTGTTPRADTLSSQTPTIDLASQTSGSTGVLENASGDSDASSTTLYDPDHHSISTRAYECWVERGCPHGSAEEDWHRAESDLRTRGLRSASTTAGS